MTRFRGKTPTRRDVLKTGVALNVGAAVAAPAILAPRRVRAAAPDGWQPEEGAELRLLRWKRFVQGDEELWMENTRKFTEATGVPVRVDNESWEDVRPKAAVAANIGSGPDIILGWFDDPHQYPDKLVDMTDLADYLGAKYGGWYPVCERYGKRDGRWIALPLGAAGVCMVYRRSWLQEAGFEELPADTDGLLDAARALAAQGRPMGCALGNAVGDGNGWLHSLLWAFGGRMVDPDNHVAIEAPETLDALDYARALYETFIPGTLSWLDPHNNKAFMAGEIGLTNNGISVYYAAKNAEDPATRALADDIAHQNYPVGPVGRPTELHLFTQAMLFRHSRYPNAAKEYLRFMMERDQYAPWQQAATGFVTQPLKAYEDNPIWQADPNYTPFRDVVSRMLWNGYSGDLGYASAAVMADYVVVNMFAEVCAGEATPKEAAARAAARAARYYRV